MKYISNHNNILRTANLSATAIVASGAIYRTSMTREGGGLVRATGTYTGQHDATYDVEIVDNTIAGVPQVSAPTFVGVGNGAMTAVAAEEGTEAQEITATLINLGTDTRRAYTPFKGVTLQAKTAGAAGNAISISVDDSGIVRTASSMSLLRDLQRDSNEMVGDEWNFGHVDLNPDGTIPAGAPRIAFGDDPQIYRAFKEYQSGRYVYSLSPAPVRDVQAGAKVYNVTGTHTVTVTNGVTPIEYENVTTLYSLLSQIEGDADGYLDVVEPVTIDMVPDGMGITEMSVRTTSYLASLERDGTQYAKDADLGLAVAPTAPTEAVTIRCANADFAGLEQWEVSGSLSGTLARATTGEAYDGTNYDFTIPVQLPPASAPSAEKSVELDLLQRSTGEQLPVFCPPRIFVLGSEAQTKTFTFVWEARPAASCECDPSDYEGIFNDDIIGVEVEDEGAMAEIPVALQSRFDDAANWFAEFSLAKTALTPADPEATLAGDPELPYIIDSTDPDAVTNHVVRRVSAVMKVDKQDINAARSAKNIHLRALLDISPSGTPDADALVIWDASYAAMKDDYEPLTTNNIGADIWRDLSAWIISSGDFDTNYTAGGYPADPSVWAARVLSNAFDNFNLRYVARMEEVTTKAGIRPNFDDAGDQGNEIWQDHREAFWFRSENGYLPLQPGYLYYAARMSIPEDGSAPVPVSTREFAISPVIGCKEKLKPGDRLVITLNVSGNLRQTYQQGDEFRLEVIRAAPAPLGGGQTGDDTLTWRVVGSVDGALENYELLKTSPAPFDDGGVSFLISPGGVAFVLGDRFSFRIEGGNARWRKDGGSWTSIAIAPTVSISDGIALAFDGGAAPSFVAGDIFHFAAEAVNGPDNLKTLRPGALCASGAPANIVVTPADAASVSAIYIGAHTLPADAAITLQGSNASDFSSIAWSETITPQAGADIYREFTASPALDYFRVQITAGSFEIGWLWLGDAPIEMVTMNGYRELGVLTKRVRVATALARQALGVRIDHEAMSYGAVEQLLTVIEHAGAYEAGRVAIACNASNEPRQNAIVRVDGESVEINDAYDFQPADTSFRWQSVSLDLAAVA
jgi:hypothetical protein